MVVYRIASELLISHHHSQNHNWATYLTRVNLGSLVLDIYSFDNNMTSLRIIMNRYMKPYSRMFSEPMSLYTDGCTHKVTITIPLNKLRMHLLTDSFRALRLDDTTYHNTFGILYARSIDIFVHQRQYMDSVDKNKSWVWEESVTPEDKFIIRQCTEGDGEWKAVIDLYKGIKPQVIRGVDYSHNRCVVTFEGTGYTVVDVDTIAKHIHPVADTISLHLIVEALRALNLGLRTQFNSKGNIERGMRFNCVFRYDRDRGPMEVLFEVLALPTSTSPFAMNNVKHLTIKTNGFD